MDSPSSSHPVVTEDKTVAIVSYITIIGFIAGIVIHSSKKTQLGAFHLRQMLGIVICAIPSVIPIIGWLWALVVLVMWVMGLIGAINGQMKPVPILGAKFQSWFSGAFN